MIPGDVESYVKGVRDGNRRLLAICASGVGKWTQDIKNGSYFKFSPNRSYIFHGSMECAGE